MSFIFVFLSNLIIAVIFDASKNSLLTLTVYSDQNKRLMKKWPILRQFYTFSLHDDINFIFWKCWSFSVDVLPILSSGKKTWFQKRAKFPHFQKWKENYFCEKINFRMSFTIPELNNCPWYSKKRLISRNAEGHTKGAESP